MAGLGALEAMAVLGAQEAMAVQRAPEAMVVRGLGLATRPGHQGLDYIAPQKNTWGDLRGTGTLWGYPQEQEPIQG